MNLLRGVARDDHVELPSGATIVVAGRGDRRRARGRAPPVGRAARGPTRPAAPATSARGRVASVELLGDRVRVRVDGPVPLIAEVTPAAVHELGLVEGAAVWTAVKATDVTVFPA